MKKQVTVRMKVDEKLADKVKGMPVRQWKEIYHSSGKRLVVIVLEEKQILM